MVLDIDINKIWEGLTQEQVLSLDAQLKRAIIRSIGDGEEWKREGVYKSPSLQSVRLEDLLLPLPFQKATGRFTREGQSYHGKIIIFLPQAENYSQKIMDLAKRDYGSSYISRGSNKAYLLKEAQPFAILDATGQFHEIFVGCSDLPVRELKDLGRAS